MYVCMYVCRKIVKFAYSHIFFYGFLRIDTPVLADQYRLTSTLYKLWMVSRGATRSNE